MVAGYGPPELRGGGKAGLIPEPAFLLGGCCRYAPRKTLTGVRGPDPHLAHCPRWPVALWVGGQGSAAHGCLISSPKHPAGLRPRLTAWMCGK